MTNEWNYQAQTQKQTLKIKEISEKLGISPIVGTLLVKRGICTVSEAKSFLNPNLKKLHNPFLYPDMKKAVDRLNKALGNKEKIMVYGDYDVDGITAVALVYKFLEMNSWKSNLEYYIPDRYDEGYGFSEKGIDLANKTGVSLIIALDCGIKANKSIEYAKSLGIDFIICDHHMPDKDLPDAIAILDAKREDSDYPYGDLSGCGVGFKFMEAFAISNGIEFSKLKSLLDLVAVSIASDIVPLTGENRIMAYYGLQQLNKRPNKGLKGIIDICGLSDKSVTMSDIVFKIGPRINASGRMLNVKEAVELLLSRDTKKAKEISKNIDQYNEDRKEIDKKTTDEANEQIERNPNAEFKKIIIVYNPDWHKGVIGIVASRLAEKYYKPAFVLTNSNGFITGSGRSSNGFDIYKALEFCKDILENFGGHMFATGMTLKKENLQEFIFQMETYAEKNMKTENMIPSFSVDTAVRLKDINQKLHNDIERLSPFGPENRKPLFCSLDVRDTGTSKLVGKENEHIKLDLVDDSSDNVTDAIAFGMYKYFDYIKQGKPFDILYTIEENNHNRPAGLQLLIKDIRIKKV